MEKEAFQKRLEDLGELAKINNNRLSTDAVKTFLKDMDLTEEQYDLVFAYLASKMITVEGYVPAADQKEGTPELSEEEQTFLTQYEEDLSYLKTVEEEALLELCREVEESGDNDAKARLTEQLLPRVVETAKHYAGRGLPIGDLIQEGNIGLMLALETLGLREEGVSVLDYLKEEIEKAVSEALEDQQTEKSAGELNILNLFPDFFNAGLQLNGVIGNLQVVGLGKDRVGLPIHLLSNEVKLAAHALFLFQCGSRMLDVAAESHDLLVHTNLIRENSHFGSDTALLNLGIGKELLHLILQLRPVLGHNLRRTLLHIIHMNQQLVELRGQIPLQILALRHAGGYELLA